MLKCSADVNSPGRVRNSGIDFLRNLSMFMVVLLHVLGVGGLLQASAGEPVKYEVLKFLQIGAVCAVNCYGLISGYVGYGSKFRIASIVTLWLQVFLYSAGFGVLFYVLKPGEVALKEVLRLCLPVLTQRYWYFTAYTALFFTMPLLNAAMEKISRRQFEISFGILLFLLTVCQQTLIVDNTFGTNSGYSYIWLIVLYCMGVYLKKYGIRIKKPVVGVAVYLGCCLACWAAQFLLTKMQMDAPNRLEGYNSPFVVLMGVVLVLLFANLRLPQWLGKTVTFLAPASFGVYLIHVHPLVMWNILEDAFLHLAEKPVWLLVPIVFAVTAGIYAICSAIDLLRHWLFRLLDIKGRLQRLESKILPKMEE